MAVVAVTFTPFVGANQIALNLSAGNYINIGTAVTQQQAYLARFDIRLLLQWRVEINLARNQMEGGSHAGPEFTDQMESSGTITVAASDGSSLVLAGISDSTEPYQWIPANQTAIAAFYTTLSGLTDKSVTVTFNDALNAPIISAQSATPTIVDHAGTSALSVTATDPDGDTLSYQWTSDSGGTFSSPTSASTNWTAPGGTTTAFVATLTCTVSDPGGLQATATVQVTVRAQAAPPLAIPDPADQTGVTNAIVSFQVPVATGGRAPYSYQFSGLPPELGFVGRLITGRLITAGNYTVTVTVTDANGDTASQTFTWTVTGADIPPPSGINVRIDWGQASFSNPEADVTSRITSAIDCFRGKEVADDTREPVVAGTMIFELDNSDGRFDQENTSSPLAGLIRPGIRVQLRDGGEPLWTGVLDSIPTRYDDSTAAQHRAMVTALGVWSELAEPPVNDGSFSPTTTAQVFCDLLQGINECGLAPGMGYFTMPRWWQVNNEPGGLLEAIRNIERTEGGLAIEDRSGNFVLQSRTHRTGRPVAATFTGLTPLPGEHRMHGRPQREIAVKDVANEIIGLVQQFAPRTGQTVFELQEPVAVALGATIELIADYEGGAVSALDAIANTDYTANTAADGSGTDRRSALSLTASIGQFNEVVLSVTYATGQGVTDSEVYLTSVVVKGTVRQRLNPLKVTRRDQTSIDRYKKKTLTLRDTWIDSMANMQARADEYLAALKDPETRLTVPWIVDDYADFRALEISDRIRVKMPGYTATAFIESIALRIPLAGANPLPVCTLQTSVER